MVVFKKNALRLYRSYPVVGTIQRGDRIKSARLLNRAAPYPQLR